MSKLKTRNSAAKRFKVTKSGKIMRRRSFTGHLKVNKSSKRKRNLRKSVEVKGQYAKRLRQALGLRNPKK